MCWCLVKVNWLWKGHYFFYSISFSHRISLSLRQNREENVEMKVPTICLEFIQNKWGFIHHIKEYYQCKNIHLQDYHYMKIMIQSTSSCCHLFLGLKLRLGLVLFQLLSLLLGIKSANNIVSFHHHLKTHLFRLVYPS